jgi:RNA polymerase subunit RPABC4/transcription elongation factor Spt4
MVSGELVDPRDDKPVPRCVAVTEGSELVVPHNDSRLIDIEWLSGLLIVLAPGNSSVTDVPSGLLMNPSLRP